MPEWKIEYDNDTGPMDDYFEEWWSVTNGDKSFRSYDEECATWLCDLLNRVAREP